LIIFPTFFAAAMARIFASVIVGATALNATSTPKCSVNGAVGGEVVKLSDGTYDRCISLITPTAAKTPMPVLFWFHGSGGNAGNCGNQADLVRLSQEHGFAYICGEATQDVFGSGGQWNIPAEITDKSGTPCSTTDSVEVGYMQAVLDHLGKSPEIYDTKSIFTSGCSMGSAFSGYVGNCLKQWDAQQISAFATHSTGLKYKGDGNRLPENWGECDGCQWWPFAPVKYTDSVGLKACIFDNTGDGDFYETSKYLAQKWPELGNPVESHFASGGHCQNIPYSDIVSCLGLGGSPTPSPTPSPVPTPTPSPMPSPSPSPAPMPSDEPSAACQQCFIQGCPELKDTARQECYDCIQQHQQSCSSSCVPYPFQQAESWYCDAKALEV
jgi:hypothetical protein